jgi:L-ascorbate metabolism protein UlaG (beta-lactamase superfamily)
MEDKEFVTRLDDGITDAVPKNLLKGISHMKQSTVKLEADKTIYVDPYEISGMPGDADFIFITHTHGDHFSLQDIRKVAKATTKIVITADGVKDLAEEGFTNILTVAPSENYVINGLEFKTVLSYNTNKYYHVRESGWVGYIITVGETRYYIAGDTDVIPEMSQIKAEVAFLPVGGTYTMTAAEAAEAANIIKPLVAVPIHYEDIVGTAEDAKTFISLLNEPIRGVILKK